MADRRGDDHVGFSWKRSFRASYLVRRSAVFRRCNAFAKQEATRHQSGMEISIHQIL